MKKIILALMLCLVAHPTMADKPAHPPHKKHKKIVVPPPVVIPPPVAEAPPPAEVEPPVVVPPPAVVVPPPPAVVPPPKICLRSVCPDESKVFVPSLHLGIGVGAQAPWASGMAGFRMEFPIAYLGVEPFVLLPTYGFGADLIVYAYRGKVVQFSPLSVGFMINTAYITGTRVDMSPLSNYISVQDVDRLIDLRLGLGVQIKLACHVKLAIDWRVSIPDPVKLAKEDGVCHECTTHGARALDASNVVGNAFAQSQLVLGVLFQ